MAGAALVLGASAAQAGVTVSSTPIYVEHGNLRYTTAAAAVSRVDPALPTQCIRTATAPLTVSGLPAGATVRRAVLRWASDQNDQNVTLAGNAVAAQVSFTDNILGAEDYYGFRADVSGIVTGNGTYSFGGLATSATFAFNGACLGGATLVVIYETTETDPNRLNRIDVFEGFEGIRGAGGATGGVASSVTLQTNFVGAQVVRATTMSWQGNSIQENAVFTDQLSINGTPISNASNPQNDANNGSGAGGAPNSVYAVDIDTFDITSLAAGATSVTFRNESTGPDYVIIQGFVLASAGTETSDAPSASYGIARHLASTTYRMGALIDHEVLDSNFAGSVNADADDQLFLNDDDGVSIPTLTQGEAATISVTVDQPSANSGRLQGWIDWNGDGDFADPGERVATDLTSAATNGTISVPITVPSDASTDLTYARFRWSSAAGLDSVAAAPDGEVEDYAVTVFAPPVFSCTRKVDIWYANDESGSVSAAEFDDALDFIYQVTDEFYHANADGAQGGIIGWASDPQPTDIIIPLSETLFDPDDRGLIQNNNVTVDNDGNGIREAYTARQSVGTGTILDRATLRLADLVAGGNGRRTGVPQVAVILTDAPASQINNATSNGGGQAWRDAADQLRASGPDGVRIIVVLLAEAAQAYQNDATARGHIDYVVGTDGTVVQTSSYAQAADPANAFIRDTADTICDAGVFPARDDYSDAPASYGDATHRVVAGIQLGAAIDIDAGSLASPNADGDGADDDGVTFPSLAPGGTGIVTVDVTGSGFLQAWIDWDGSGAFDSPVERIATDVQDADGDGTISLEVSVPSYATAAQTFARFRWSTDFGIAATGAASDGEVEDYAVALDGTGPALSGRIFIDNGTGGGTAHNALVDGLEQGTDRARLAILDGAGTLLAMPPVGADGRWSYRLPAGFSASIRLTVTPEPGLLTVSERNAGLPALTNADPHDGTFAFTPAAGTSYDTLDFGLIERPTLVQNRIADIGAGQVLNLTHRYLATTAGSVTLSLVDEVQNPAGGFVATLFEDVGCDDTPDQAFPSPRIVAAGQSVCIVIRIQAGGGVGAGATYTYGLVASTAFTAIARSDTARNDDRIGSAGANELVLLKRVQNITQGTAEATTNAGSINDVLQYRLIISNPGAAPVEDVSVYDRTPAFTRLSEAIPDPVEVLPGVTCDLQVPASNAANYAGALEWRCPGSFPAGGTGSLTFRVVITP